MSSSAPSRSGAHDKEELLLKPRRPVATQKSTPPVQASSALSQDVTLVAELPSFKALALFLSFC